MSFLDMKLLGESDTPACSSFCQADSTEWTLTGAQLIICKEMFASWITFWAQEVEIGALSSQTRGNQRRLQQFFIPMLDCSISLAEWNIRGGHVCTNRKFWRFVQKITEKPLVELGKTQQGLLGSKPRTYCTVPGLLASSPGCHCVALGNESYSSTAWSR